MDDCMHDHEGITLPPISQTRLVAREVAEQVLREHMGLCPFAALKIEQRLRTVEVRFAALLAFMLGSGLLGGLTGAGLIQLLHK